jgi:hypothetical protein
MHDKTCPQHTKNRDKHDPIKIFGQVVLDAFILIASYAFVSCVMDSCETIHTNGVLLFLTVFIPLGMFVRSMEVEYQEQLTRVAFFHLATKIFNAMTIL